MKQPFSSALLAVLVVLAGCATTEELRRAEIGRAIQSAQFDEVLVLAEREVKDPATASNEQLFPICLAHAQMKRYDRLFPCLDRLDANVAKGDASLIKASSYLRVRADLARYLLRAEALVELGRYDAAIAVTHAYDARPGTGFLDALEESASSSAVRVLPVVGVALALKGDREGARRIARQLDEVGVLPLPVLIETKHAGLARIHAAAGDFAKAFEHVEQTDQTGFAVLLSLLAATSRQTTLSSAVLPPNYPYILLPRLYLRMKCLLEIGRREEAKRGFDALLARPQLRVNGEIYWMTLYDRGRIAEAEGDAAGAKRYYQRAIEVIEQFRSSINTEANKIGFVGDKQVVYARLIGLLVTAGAVELAFEYVERSKSRALVDMLAGQQDFAPRSGATADVRALLEKARVSELFSREQSSTAGSLRGAPAAAKAALDAVPEEIASLVSVRTLTAADVRGRIAVDETLIEYYHGASRLIAFVMTRGHAVAVELDGQGLADDVGGLRRAIMLAPTDRYRAPASRLFERVIAPLRPYLAGTNLTIVPHGVLHYVPFNALLDGDRFLVERHAVRTLPSASVLKFLGDAAPAKASAMLTLGSPDLGDPKFRLPGARREAIAIGELFAPSVVLLEEFATETAFRRHAAGFRYLHVASHGEFFPDAPLQSRLRLARDTENDGLLTVGELYGLRLDVEMVTLSACETGLGDLANGDEYVGLTRGFLFAGARSVVASMWKVDDASTLELMRAFYGDLHSAGRREALRRAQAAQASQRRHPFFWAAFQLTGSER